MAQQKVAYPQAERTRTLQALSFSENAILSRDLPRDTVLKGLVIRLSGAVTTTFASGTPVSDAQSIVDNIAPRIDVIVNGSRVVASVRPHMLKMQQLFTTQILAERRSSAGASALTTLPTVDAGFTYGTTGQVTTCAETIYLPFEHVYCDLGMGREATWLNLKGVASAELRITCAAFSKLLGFGNTAPVVYSSSTLQFDIFTKEAADVPAEISFSDWKRSTKQITFSAETADFAVDINRGNKLSGLLIFAQDGAAGTATTASGKLASNNAITKMQFVVNGQTTMKSLTFLALQNQNRADYGVNAPMASNVSIIDGVAHMNFLARKDISTALPLMPPLVDNAQLFLSTNTASNVSYTNPVGVTIQTEEVVEPR